MPEYSDSKDDEHVNLIDGKAQPDVTKDGKVEAPRKVIPNAVAAKTIYDRLRAGHEKRARTFARIQGMLDGNPPYPPQTMKRMGLVTQSNINWRDGESIYESVATAYWSLLNDVQYVAQFTTDIGDVRQNAEIGQIVSEEFDAVLRDWRSFSPLMTKHQADLIKFGMSFVFWPDEDSWKWEVGDVWRVLVPERTRNDIAHFSMVMIEEIRSAYELFDIVEREANSEGKVGYWDQEVVKKILFYTSNIGREKKQYSGSEFAAMQRQIRNGDTTIEDQYNDDIMIVSVFVKEHDGRISHGMFVPDVCSYERDWAFFADRQYENMNQALWFFTFTPGEEHVHGSKGLGQRIYNTIEGTTRLDNSLMDGAQRASTVLVRSKAGRGKDPRQINFIHGGFIDVGEMEFEQNLMGSNLSSNVEVSRYFRGKLEMNNNISGAFTANPDMKPRTASEARIQIGREARPQKTRVAHYYEQLDVLLQEAVRKMLLAKKGDDGFDEVDNWRKRCIKRGVPKEFFELNEDNKGRNGLPEHITSLKATRSQGSGSQLLDQMESDSMMSLLPVAGERGRINILKDRVSAYRGYRYIDRYFPPEDRTNQPTSEHTLASIENNQLEKGEMVVVSPDNNHAVHVPSHIQRLQQIAKLFNEGENAARESGSDKPSLEAGSFSQYSLEETDVAFQTLGPHIVRHLLLLSQDPTRKELAQSMQAQWAILANFGDKIANNAQEHRESQLREMRKGDEEMDKLDMEERVKMRQVDVDANIKMRKLVADIQRAANRDSLEYMLKRARVSFENELDRAKAVSELALDAQAQQQEGQQSDTEKTRGRADTALY